MRRWGQAAAAAPMRIGPPASISFVADRGGPVLLDRGARCARRRGCVRGGRDRDLDAVAHRLPLRRAADVHDPRLTGIAHADRVDAPRAGHRGGGERAGSRADADARSSRGAAGILVRRALRSSSCCALPIGWMRVLTPGSGLVDTALGTALRTLVEIALLTVLLWWAAARVRTQERALRESEAEVRRQASELAAFLDTAAIGCTGSVRTAHPVGQRRGARDARLRARRVRRPPHRRVPCRSRRSIADILARLHAASRLREYPARMRCKDGSLKSVLIDSSVLWDEGRFVHTQCFTRDVTERERAEETRALLAAIVEASDDAVVSKTLDGIDHELERRRRAHLRLQAAEVIGRPIDVIIPPDRLEEEQRHPPPAPARRAHRPLRDRAPREGRSPGRHLADDLARQGRVGPDHRRVEDRARHHRSQARGGWSARRATGARTSSSRSSAHELRNPLAPVRNAARYLKLAGPGRPAISGVRSTSSSGRWRRCRG